MQFTLHPQLAKDTFCVIDWSLSRLLLHNDSQYPWLVLVPRLQNIQELYELSTNESSLLMQEITHASKLLVNVFQPYKINVATLGNIVPQLHVHIIARYQHDAAWPKPVWGVKQAVAYANTKAEELVNTLRQAL